jgi:hypothetical protein
MARPKFLWWLAFPVLLLAPIAYISPWVACAQQPESWPHLTPDEIKLYQNAPTLLEWTPKEIHSHPELRSLHPAQSQGDLPRILDEVGKRIEVFFRDFRDTTCTEKIQAEACRIETGLRILPGGIPQEYGTGSMNCNVLYDGNFRYLRLVHMRKEVPFLEEYRTDAKGNAIDYDQLNGLPLLTYGFSAVALYFHPLNRAACRFHYFGRQMFKGLQTEVVGFAQIPEENTPVITFKIGKLSGHILEQGLAWIDAATHEILCIQTDLLAPRPDLRMDKQTSKIDFKAIHLAEISAPLWLPTKVVVDLESSHQHLRNTHSYSDFKMFRVESRIGAIPGN